MNEPTLDVKKDIVKNKLAQWERTYFSSKIDARVAKDIGNEALLKNAATAMQQCLKGIAFLEATLEDMEQATEETKCS